MASEVSICNLALSEVGTKNNIASLIEDSNEARQCNIVYANLRDAILRGHPWKFAQKRKALALLSDPPSDWTYMYQYPSDCLKALYILPPSRTLSDPLPFDVGVSDDLTSKVILTDTEGAYLKYTARVTNVTLFDSICVQALAFAIGAQIAKPLTGSTEVARLMKEAYNSAISQAYTANLIEAEKDKPREASWIEDR